MIKRVLKTASGMPPSAIFGAIIICLYLVMAVFAPLVAPYNPDAIVAANYLGPSLAHPLGTDHLGRDMLSRVIFGARNTVLLTLVTTMLVFLIGATMGLIAAVRGGIVDQIFSRLVDAILSVPILIFGLLLLTVFGTSIPVLVIVIAVLESPRVYRLARAVGMDVAVKEFVEAARLRGEGMAWIIRREILPNVLSPLIAEFGMRFCFVLLLISALSFLGLGIQPPTADWGSMVRANAGVIAFGNPAPLFPAGAIALLTVAVNLVVDWFLFDISGLSR